MGWGISPCPPMPTGASTANAMPEGVRAVNAPLPLYVTVMSTGFHSIRYLSQGISALMLYRLSRGDMKECREDGRPGCGGSSGRVIRPENSGHFHGRYSSRTG